MKQLQIYIGFLLLSIFYGTFCTSLKEKHVDILEYYYKGFVDMKTTACSNSFARWNIDAEVITNKFSNYTVIKLNNVKTYLYHKTTNDIEMNNYISKEIPEESKILEQAFVFKQGKREDFKLFFKPGEPLWSINMKKGIANFLNFEYKEHDESNGNIKPFIEPTKTKEQSLYGNCYFTYSCINAFENTYVYEKKMNNWNCTDTPIDHVANVNAAPGIRDFNDILNFKNNKILTLNKTDGKFIPFELVSKTKIEYKITPSAIYSLVNEQRQSIKLKTAYSSVKIIDLSEFTEEKDLIYDLDIEQTLGIHIYEKNQTILVNKFLDIYKNFEKKFSFSTPEHYNIRDEDNVQNMYKILEIMNIKGLITLGNIILHQKQTEFEYFFLTLLQYVGTDASVAYINKFVLSKQMMFFYLKEYRVALTPLYARNPTEAMLDEWAKLLHNNISYKIDVKNNAVLSLGSLVGTACFKDSISTKCKNKYIQMFYNKFTGGEDYSEKMIHLLGLVNMAQCLDYDFINNITTNSSVTSNLRALAITGFKKYLEFNPKIYHTYWPLVENKSEELEVRVAALDLLLSSDLSKDELNTIVNTFSGQLSDLEDKHLANYLLSSLHSLQNSTRYFDHLGSHASEILKNNNISVHSSETTTGFYRLAYTDEVPNFGASLETRLLTNPKTNILNTIQLSYNSFGMSFDFGTINLYLKLDGVINMLKLDSILKKNEELPTIPEILKLLNENNFIIKNPEKPIHIDIVIFVDGVALFANHRQDQFDFDDLKRYGSEFFRILNDLMHVSFPVIDYKHIPSELGTPMKISNLRQNIVKCKNKNMKELYYRSSLSYHTWIDSYNPLIDANIANYKYRVDEMNLYLNYTISKSNITVSWQNDKAFSHIWDSMLGTSVHKEKLKEYCPKCDAYNEQPILISNTRISDYDSLGFKLRLQIDKNRNDDYYQIKPLINTDAFPFAAPVIRLLAVINNQFWLRSDLSRVSQRSISSAGSNQSTLTTLMFNFNHTNDFIFKTNNTIKFNMNLKVKDIETDKVLSSVNMTGAYEWKSHYTEHRISRVIEMYFTYNSSNNGSVEVFANVHLQYPYLRSCKLNLLPYEPIISETNFTYANYVNDDENCDLDLNCIFKEANDKNTTLKNEDIINKDYIKCTIECKRVSRLSENDKYLLNLTMIHHKENSSEIMMNENWFTYNRVYTDTTQLKFRKDWKIEIMRNFADNRTVYYPKSIYSNLIDVVYNNGDPGILFNSRSSCTITPSIIQNFMNTNLPNNNRTWLAFAECFNSPRIALSGYTIDNKHVGFTYYSNGNIIEATIKNDTLYVTLNGQHITEPNYNNTLEIYFLNENVFFIVDNEIEIYYNTQYIYMEVNTIFSTYLCGVCMYV